MPIITDKLYKDLGVPPDADQAAVKKAYRRKAKRHHPDAGGDPETFRAINTAYVVLSDPLKREKYDRTGVSEEKIEQPLSRAINEACKLVIECIEAGEENVLVQSRRVVTEAKTRISVAFRKSQDAEARLRKAAARLKKKSGDENILSAAVENHAAGHATQQALMTEELKHLDNVLLVLKEYDFTPEVHTFGTIKFTWGQGPVEEKVYGRR